MRKVLGISVVAALLIGCNGGGTAPPFFNPLALYSSNASTTLKGYALPFSSGASPTVTLLGFGNADDTAADASSHIFELDNGPTPPVIVQYNRPIASASVSTATIAVTGTISCGNLTPDGSGNLWVGCFGAGVKEVAGPFTATGSYNGTILATLLGTTSAYQLAFDGSGDLFVADNGSGKVQIYKAPVLNLNSPSGSLTIPAAHGVAVDGSGNVYADSDSDNSLRRWNGPVSLTTFNQAASVIDTATGLVNVRGMSLDGNGNLYVGTCSSTVVGSVAVFSNPAAITAATPPSFVNSTTGCSYTARITLK
jgi:hypothetical protein